MNIFRYFGFTAHGDEYRLKISCGLFNRREYRITSAHINYTDLRQNLIMKFLGTVAVNISCAGYGSAKNHLPVLLPVGKEKNIGKTLGKIGIFGGASNEFRPQKNGWWQYIWKPVITAVMIFPLHIFTGKIFPDISELTFFFSVMSAVPLLWFLAVGFTSFFTSGVSFCDSKIILRCSNGTDFHTVVAERSHIVKVGIRQTVFQQINGKCTLLLWIGSEERSHFRIKSLKLSDAVEICKMLDYNINECF
ncbi:MAG: PH domain-containing protein [Ruminococcus sp.]|nr:PH domain-containing protein [Ruminococcus sp.]